MISVVIPSYNRAKTIKQSAESVLHQTFKDLELIIVDDCSSDNTKDIVAELMISDSRVRYVCHEKNKGACAARNTGIDASRGQYIAFQDSDDAWRPEKLERQIDIMKKYDADICYCKVQRHNYPASISSIYPIQPEGIIDYNILISKSHASTQTILAKSEVLREHKFDINIKQCQDLDWCIRAGRNNVVAFANEVLVDIYLQGDSISTLQAHQKIMISYETLLKKYEDIANEYPSFHLKLLNMIGKQRALTGDKSGLEYKIAYKITGNKKYILKQVAYRMGVLKVGYEIRERIKK